MNYCPECGSKKLERISNELICKNCGLVVEEF
jgi:transcription initiation factor TFIIIB Brf1 subunit/transcription initiation factor TFIIB